MKKIIAAFDGFKYAESTENYSIYLSQKTGALLTGVFLEDFTYHSYKLFDMVGSEGVAPEKVKQLMDNDRRIRNSSVQRFEDTCKTAGVKAIIHRDKNLALHDLLKETIYSDLLVISKKETLTHFPEELPTNFVRSLLVDVQCPVLIVPEIFKEPERIVILYDGAPSSVYASRMFSYMLPQLVKLPVEVISVEPEGNIKTLHEPKLIREFIDCHYPEAKFRLLKGDSESEIVNYLKNEQDVIVVLGAYQRGMVSRWFKSSMADILMEECNVPLFIAHYK